MNKLYTVVAIFTLITCCTSFGMKRSCNTMKHENEMRQLERTFKKSRPLQPISTNIKPPMKLSALKAVKHPKELSDLEVECLAQSCYDKMNSCVSKKPDLTKEDLENWLEIL